MNFRLQISDTKQEMAQRAASAGANLVRSAIAERGAANIIVATGASQFEMLDALAKETIPWNLVTVFHLDEYVGLPIDHPASFRLYLWKRFQSRLPLPTKAFHYLDAEKDAAAECGRVGKIISDNPIDVAFVGIGENGHLAFNDPPADFETEVSYLLVDLDQACREQQLGEGWFPDLESVPTKAISMSIKQIMKSKSIICTVPDERKSVAVRDCVELEISPDRPASILRNHDDCQLFLDGAAASKLKPAVD